MTTPEEAQQALLDIEERQQQSTAAARSSRWWWILGGLGVIAFGVATELAPGFIDDWGTVIVWAMVFLAIARSSRWGARFFGRQVRPRLAGSTAQRLGMGAIGAVGALVLLGALWLDVPHVALGFSIVGGLLLMVAGPWWEDRVLARGSRT
ncbi:hypothetical protein [Actinoplanes sp. NPDC051494]|uniref:hypothetical protein n=1 Tax=Actinoplanes sp. NPDC051494 TaxID=3363907 RepID=UPI0037A24260